MTVVTDGLDTLKANPFLDPLKVAAIQSTNRRCRKDNVRINSIIFG